MRAGLSRGAALGAAVLAGLLITGANAAPALADDPITGGGDTDTGYGVGAYRPAVSGDVDPGKVASIPGPPPLCWWEPLDVDIYNGAPGDPTNVEDVEAWWDSLAPYLTGHAAEGALALRDGSLQDAAAYMAAHPDSKISFYQLDYDQSQLTGDGYEQAATLSGRGCGSGTRPGRYGPVLVTIDWFVVGQQPEPVIDPATLAQYAYDVMDLVEPALDWNPRIGATGGSTLVNLPTWLWVDDDAAVAQRAVTATAGDVSATVTATTTGISVTSPAGTTTCDNAAASTAYAAGVAEAYACTLPFSRASWGYPTGFPVDAQSVWNAAWTSNTGAGGDLEAKSVGATTYIPVAESQTVVTRAD